MSVVDQQPRLEVLAVVGEVQAEQLGVPARGGEPHMGRHPHHLAAQRDYGMPQYRVLAERGMMHADVDGVVGPVGDPHHGEPRGVADDEFDVVGVGSAAPLVDDYDRLAKLFHPDLQMPIGHRAFAGPGDGDVHRLSGLRVSPDGDQRRRVERRKCLGRNTIGGNTALAQPLVAAAHGLHLHARPVR